MKARPFLDRATVAQWGALAIGVAYIVAGVGGFAVTGFGGFVENTDKAFIGFDLNPFHNIVHLGVGSLLLGVALVPQSSIAEGALLGGGLLYLAAAFLGFINALPILSIASVLAPDNFLHVVSGTAAFAIGLIGSLRTGSGEPEPDRPARGPIHT